MAPQTAPVPCTPAAASPVATATAPVSKAEAPCAHLSADAQARLEAAYNRWPNDHRAFAEADQPAPCAPDRAAGPAQPSGPPLVLGPAVKPATPAVPCTQVSQPAASGARHRSSSVRFATSGPCSAMPSAPDLVGRPAQLIAQAHQQYQGSCPHTPAEPCSSRGPCPPAPLAFQDCALQLMNVLNHSDETLRGVLAGVAGPMRWRLLRLTAATLELNMASMDRVLSSATAAPPATYAEAASRGAATAPQPAVPSGPPCKTQACVPEAPATPASAAAASASVPVVPHKPAHPLFVPLRPSPKMAKGKGPPPGTTSSTPPVAAATAPVTPPKPSPVAPSPKPAHTVSFSAAVQPEPEPVGATPTPSSPVQAVPAPTPRERCRTFPVQSSELPANTTFADMPEPVDQVMEVLPVEVHDAPRFEHRRRRSVSRRARSSNDLPEAGSWRICRRPCPDCRVEVCGRPIDPSRRDHRKHYCTGCKRIREDAGDWPPHNWYP